MAEHSDNFGAKSRYIIVDSKKVYIDSIATYNALYGLPDRNPLIAVVDLKEAKTIANNMQVTYGVYALFLKMGTGCSLKYGLKTYEFAKGTVVSFAPGKIIDVYMTDDEITDEVIGILFHPDFIKGSILEPEMAQFRYLDYAHMEAIPLTEDEMKMFSQTIANIHQELLDTDHHSDKVILANLRLLLKYLNRSHERQMEDAKPMHTGIVAQMKRMLDGYYDATFKGDTLPDVSYFAERLSISAKHLSHQIKKESGMSAKELIANHIVDMAKYKLTVTDSDIGVLAYGLGFRHPAHFSRMFRRLTGQTPTEFRQALKK